MEDRFLNQKGLIDEKKLAETKFVVVGAGAIGSFFTVNLSKMGARAMTVYDHDTLEDHNIANQLFPLHYVGNNKAEALKTVSLSYGECEIRPINQKWTPENAEQADIVVSAVDNMDVRKAIWDYYKGKCKFFVDGRMAALFYRVYGIDMSNAEAINFYESTLYPQKEAMPERCGHKSIIYTVGMVSGEMGAQVRDWIMGLYRPSETLYDALNRRCQTKYHMKPNYEVIEEEETVEV